MTVLSKKLAEMRGLVPIIFFFLVSVAASVIYALTAEESYTATVRFLPSGEDGGLGGAAAAMGSLGGLASSLGVSFGGQTTETKLAQLGSADTLVPFIKKHGLENTLSVDENMREETRLLKYFKRDHFSYSADLRSSVISLSITWGSALEATNLANDFFEFANARASANQLRQIDLRLEFLEMTLSDTSEESVRTAIYNLIEHELKKQMDVKTNPQYAFALVEKARVPYQRAWPRRGLIVVLTVMFSSIMALAALFFLNMRALISRLEDGVEPGGN